MSIPKVNLSRLINGFTFVSSDIEFHPDISQQETHMAQKYATFDEEIKELGIMKKALRWDLDQTGKFSAQDMQEKSSAKPLRHHHHEVSLLQNQVVPILSKVCFNIFVHLTLLES